MLQKVQAVAHTGVPRAVVFDFGKVISFPPEPGVMAELASIAGIEVKTMDTLVWAYRGEYDRGTLSGKDYYRTLLTQGGREAVAQDDAALERLIRIDLASWKRVNPDTVALMEDIKAGGYALGILSNMPQDFLVWARESLPVFRLPDVGIFSCEIGSIKPEIAMYETLLHALSCKPEEVVFFDDIPVNVEAACSVGIRGLVWQDPQSSRKVLQGLGLCIP
jgi:putative hydrolase of the HAD superfamily